MMTDKELLELAAKARGFKISGWNSRGGIDVAALEDGTFWQPLLENNITDCDGDALRLAVKLGIQIDPREPETRAYSRAPEVIREHHNIGAEEATRRVIVRAAAAIGEAMQ